VDQSGELARRAGEHERLVLRATDDERRTGLGQPSP